MVFICHPHDQLTKNKNLQKQVDESKQKFDKLNKKYVSQFDEKRQLKTK